MPLAIRLLASVLLPIFVACVPLVEPLTTVDGEIRATPGLPLSPDYPAQPEGLTRGRVLHVVDGDTVDVEVQGTEVRLRLIGLNTPETVDPRRPVQCFGLEASEKAKEFLIGQSVWLEGDPTQGDTDRYNRLLRYLWLPDGRLYNLEMIRLGYANEYTYDVPYKYHSVFQQTEDEARENQRGFWSSETCNGDTEQAAPPTPTPIPTNCDPAYPDVCIPPPPPDLDCSEFPHRNFRVLPPDPHRFDAGGDGMGCEG